MTPISLKNTRKEKEKEGKRPQVKKKAGHTHDFYIADVLNVKKPLASQRCRSLDNGASFSKIQVDIYLIRAIFVRPNFRDFLNSQNKILAKFTHAKFNTLIANLHNDTNESINAINKLVPTKLPPEDAFEDVDNVKICKNCRTSKWLIVCSVCRSSCLC